MATKKPTKKPSKSVPNVMMTRKSPAGMKNFQPKMK